MLLGCHPNILEKLIAKKVFPNNFMLPLACLKNNVNYPGNDVNHCDMRTSSVEGCQLLCQKRQTCESFTWIGPKVYPKADRKKCCLKYQKSPSSASATGMVSGPKFCRGIILTITKYNIIYGYYLLC